MDKKIISIPPTARYMLHDDKVIILNRTNGQWMKVSKECSDILMEYNQKITYEELYKNSYDDEDEKYMRDVVSLLEKIQLLGSNIHLGLKDVVFAISNRCNLYCRHCAVNADSCQKKENLSTEQVINALCKIIEATPKRIVITGGEPLHKK